MEGYCRVGAKPVLCIKEVTMKSFQDIQWIKDPKGDVIDDVPNPSSLLIYKKMAPNAPNLRVENPNNNTCLICVSIKPKGGCIETCVLYGLYYNWLDVRFHKIGPFANQLVCDSIFGPI